MLGQVQVDEKGGEIAAFTTLPWAQIDVAAGQRASGHGRVATRAITGPAVSTAT